MRSRNLVATVVVGLTFGSMACVEASPYDLTASKERSRLSAAGEDEDEFDSDSDSDSDPDSPRGFTTPAPAAAPVLTTLTVTFGGKNARRECSDNGAKRSKASFFQSTGLALALVDDPKKPIAALTQEHPVNGTTIEQLKAAFLQTGTLALPVDPKELSATPKLYAIIAYGAGFGDPQQCNYQVAPPKDGDAENFGENCGIVGYLTASYDAATKKVTATPSSQFLWASNPNTEKQGSSYWKAPKGGAGCDEYDSPLVLDLSPTHHGVTLGAPMSSVFDIDGDGTADRLPWITSDDTPLLALDANGNGVVDGIDELFGNKTRSPLGLRQSENGFEALAAWDANGDGVIDAADPVWDKLRLWFDRNHDGKTDAGELETLGARGLRSIAVSFVSVDDRLLAGGELQGVVRQRGAASATDGRIVPVVDVWFRRQF